jgi:hypothetical protein
MIDFLDVGINKVKKYNKKYGKFYIGDDYLYLNPSPPRNFGNNQ